MRIEILHMRVFRNIFISGALLPTEGYKIVSCISSDIATNITDIKRRNPKLIKFRLNSANSGSLGVVFGHIGRNIGSLYLMSSKFIEINFSFSANKHGISFQSNQDGSNQIVRKDLNFSNSSCDRKQNT